MENERYWREGIDWKRIFLLWRKKLWVLVAAALAGALLGGGIYFVVCVLPAANREYESVSKVYLNFNCEPEDFSELSYNGYTWNDLMVTDPILDSTMENLPPEIERETVIGATKAEILSDIRLLTVTITADRPELAAQIMEATQASLVHLGETDELFESIEIYSTTEPKQVVWDNRNARAAVTGAVIALVAALFVAAFYYVMDDSVYVAEDVRKRYGIPGMGILTGDLQGLGKKAEGARNCGNGHRDGKRQGNEGREDDRRREGFEGEFLANYQYICEGMKRVAVISADGAEDAEWVVKRLEQLIKKAGCLAEEGDTMAADAVWPSYMAVDGEKDENVYQKLRDADGVILAVRFGGKNGKRIERLLGNLKNQGCKVAGAVIAGGDENFLRMYYAGGGGSGEGPDDMMM